MSIWLKAENIGRNGINRHIFENRLHDPKCATTSSPTRIGTRIRLSFKPYGMHAWPGFALLRRCPRKIGAGRKDPLRRLGACPSKTALEGRHKLLSTESFFPVHSRLLHRSIFGLHQDSTECRSRDSVAIERAPTVRGCESWLLLHLLTALPTLWGYLR